MMKFIDNHFILSICKNRQKSRYNQQSKNDN